MIEFSGVNLTQYIHNVTESAANTLMDAEASAVVQAAHYERNGTRTAYRNGYRVRQWNTETGTIALHIPKLRSGSYYPAFLEDSDAAAERFALLARFALVKDVSAEMIAPLLTDMDEEVAERVAAEINDQAQTYLSRRLHHAYPTLIIEKQGDYAIIYGERLTGIRHLLDVRDYDTGSAYWRAIVRDLLERGLSGVEIIEADPEIEAAVRQQVWSPEMIVAIGLPVDQQSIDRSQPHAMLFYHLDAVLHADINMKALLHLRRMMEGHHDAVGVPLERIA